MDGKRIQEQKGTYCFLFEGIKLTQNHQITIYGYCGDEKVCEDEAAFTHTDGLEAEYILESGEMTESTGSWMSMEKKEA